MFTVIFLASYFLPNLYVFFRIKSLIRRKSHKIIFTVIYLIIVLFIPVAEIMAHRSEGESISFLLILGYYLLPFLLYLFLIVLLLDILFLLNRLLKVIPAEIIKSQRFRKVRLSLLLIIPVLILIAGAINHSAIKVNEYRIQIPRKNSTIHDLKIALASDFHLREITAKYFMEQFAAKVNSLNADILLLPGDILEGNRQNGQLEEFEMRFRSIQTKYGTYATLGNHEFYRRNVKLDFFHKSSITLLQDSAIVIDNAFTIIGRNDNHLRSRKTIGELMGTVKHDLPVIVLDHRPTELSQVSATDADILLCGHTHHGQLFPFNYITEKVYELSWGYKKIGNTNVFVTSGVQLWGPPVRTAGYSEILVISVDFVDDVTTEK